MDVSGGWAMKSPAVLLMAYGSPARPEDSESDRTHSRGGDCPSPEATADLRRRYDAIGGRSPLLEITRSQAAELQHALEGAGIRAPVFVGMKHWHPFIRDVVTDIVAKGFEQIIGIALAPHYSRISIEGYEAATHEGLRACGGSTELVMVRDWHLEPGLIRTWVDAIGAIQRARPEFGEDGARILFSAHSLPKRILDEGDPYPQQLKETCTAIAEKLGTDRWAFAWQSAGSRGTWLGPSVLETLDELAVHGVKAVLSAPIGFTSDHLEILYDLDIEAGRHAIDLGIQWARAPLPNASPMFIDTLVSLVQRASRDHT